MHWNDLSLDRQIWTQPAASNKSGRIHIVPLSNPALDTIRSLPRVHNDLVFPARGTNRPVSGFSKWKQRLDQLSGVRNWTLHDLRRTVATGMGALNIALHIVELVLNHTSKSLSGVAGIYNRHSYLDERRQALTLWARHVERLVQQTQPTPASEEMRSPFRPSAPN